MTGAPRRAVLVAILGVLIVIAAVVLAVVLSGPDRPPPRPPGSGPYGPSSGPGSAPGSGPGPGPGPRTVDRVARRRYYSYALTVLKGGVIPPLFCSQCGPRGTETVRGSMFALVGDPLLDNGSPLYQIGYKPWKDETFVDWDASSGLMCGNSWGQPSKQAQIAYNVISLTAPNPIIQNREIHTQLTKLLFYGPDGKSPGSTSWQSNMQTNSSECMGATAGQELWDAGASYVVGWMTSWWWDSSAYDYVCRWCHYGATYGYTSLTQFFNGADSQFFGFLAGRDVVFVVVSNADSLGKFAVDGTGDAQTPYDDAVANLVGRLQKRQTPIGSDGQLQAALTASLTAAYKKLTGFPGLTATMGYYFVDAHGKEHSGSRTVSVIDGAVKTPGTEYPFKGGGGVKYLGAVGADGLEPSYYYGSGTKPISIALTTHALSMAWKLTNPKGTAAQFITWYLGPHGVVTSPESGYEFLTTYGAASMTDVLALKGQSYYSETIQAFTNRGDPLNVGNPAYTTATHPIQDWYKIIYGPEGCSTWRGLSQQATSCPSNQCLEVSHPKGCACPPMPMVNLLSTFMTMLSPLALTCMQGGVSDADSVLAPGGGPALDFTDQAVMRTESIGPMNFVRESVGFNWYPGYTTPTTPRTANWANSWISPGQYSSSGITLLGSLLWVFDPNGPQAPQGAVDWTAIRLNESFFPPALQKLNNFAGTSGNGGAQFFVPAGGQPQQGVLPGCNIANDYRTDCIGPTGADPAVCGWHAECCYQPSTVAVDGAPVPWCFTKAG